MGLVLRVIPTSHSMPIRGCERMHHESALESSNLRSSNEVANTKFTRRCTNRRFANDYGVQNDSIQHNSKKRIDQHQPKHIQATEGRKNQIQQRKPLDSDQGRKMTKLTSTSMSTPKVTQHRTNAQQLQTSHNHNTRKPLVCTSTPTK